MAGPGEQGVRIGLSAVVIALRDRKACVLTTTGEDGAAALPFGPFDPTRDRTFERALRDFVTDQTGFRLGFSNSLHPAIWAAPVRETPAPNASRGLGRLPRPDRAPPTPQPRPAGPRARNLPWETAATATRLLRPTDRRPENWARRPRRQPRRDPLATTRRIVERGPGHGRTKFYPKPGCREAAGKEKRPGPAPPDELARTTAHLAPAWPSGSKLKYRPVLFDLSPRPSPGPNSTARGRGGCR